MYGEVAEAEGGVWDKAGFLEADDLSFVNTCKVV
jgi:hypothetical protein